MLGSSRNWNVREFAELGVLNKLFGASVSEPQSARGAPIGQIRIVGARRARAKPVHACMSASGSMCIQAARASKTSGGRWNRRKLGASAIETSGEGGRRRPETVEQTEARRQCNVVSRSQTLTPSGRESGTLPTCEWFWPAPQLGCKMSG